MKIYMVSLLHRATINYVPAYDLQPVVRICHVRFCTRLCTHSSKCGPLFSGVLCRIGFSYYDVTLKVTQGHWLMTPFDTLYVTSY